MLRWLGSRTRRRRGTCRRVRSAGGDGHGTHVGRHCRFSRRRSGEAARPLALPQTPCPSPRLYSGPLETDGKAALTVARFVKRVPGIGPAPVPKAGSHGWARGLGNGSLPVRLKLGGWVPVPARHGAVDAGSSVAGPLWSDGRGGQPGHPTTGSEAPALPPGSAARAVRAPVPVRKFAPVPLRWSCLPRTDGAFCRWETPQPVACREYKVSPGPGTRTCPARPRLGRTPGRRHWCLVKSAVRLGRCRRSGELRTLKPARRAGSGAGPVVSPRRPGPRCRGRVHGPARIAWDRHC